MTFLDLQLTLRIVLAVIFIGAGATHFLGGVQRTMAAMIPPQLRFDGIANPRNLVIFTGVCEIAGGIGLLVPATSAAAGIALVVFLAAIFPANAYAAAHKKRFGWVAFPVLPRLVAQLVLMALIVLAIV